MPQYTYDLSGFVITTQDSGGGIEILSTDTADMAVESLSGNGGFGQFTYNEPSGPYAFWQTSYISAEITSGLGTVDPLTELYVFVGDIANPNGGTTTILGFETYDESTNTSTIYVFPIGGAEFDVTDVALIQDAMALNPGGPTQCGFGSAVQPGVIYELGDFFGVPTQIDGNNSSEEIEGTEGDDIIQGFGGNDDLEGDEGNDTIYGGDGFDIIKGDEGNDDLYGGAGFIDILIGGAGADTLTGGEGRDIFIVDRNDTVVDFDETEDRIITIGRAPAADEFDLG